MLSGSQIHCHSLAAVYPEHFGGGEAGRIPSQQQRETITASP
jgi:hypothetical protein